MMQANTISWTWADQISSYRFWGLFLYFVFLLIPTILINFFGYLFSTGDFGYSQKDIGIFMTIKSIAPLGGFILAWFMVRLKNHYLLFLFSGLTIIGFILLLTPPSILILLLVGFLIGISFGAIALAVPAIIAGGRGGSEMFIVSFGIITCIEILINNTTPLFFEFFNYKSIVITCLISTIIGTILLIPIKSGFFNVDPPKREFAFAPIARNPLLIILLCLLPIYNIYFILHLVYRFHGEVNSFNSTQNILSPRAAVWSYLLIPFISPIILSSLNSNLTPIFLQNNTHNYHKTWVIILWAIVFFPVSFALIQSNMNKILLKY